MTTVARARLRPFVGPSPPANVGVGGLGWVFASEAAASVLGFLALVHQARRLGPGSFARVEYAAAVTAWLLVVVRGGFDVIVYREAARRPRLVAPLTDLLLGLRTIAACASFGVVLVLAALVGPGRGAVVTVSGLLLFASVWVVDVGPRAEGRLASVALAQVIRALGLTGSVVLLVRGPGHVLRASACLVGAEMLGAAVALAVHRRRYGALRPRWRRCASLTLARLGLVAGLTRFGRVTLYGLDMLALGWWAGGGLGPYAAARRVVFALLALGMVVPAMVGPSIARAWSFGLDEARARVGSAMDGLWALALPATLGLVLTSDRAMPRLFGPGYEDGGAWLALAAARLPWLLSGTLAQTVLVSCRREAWCLRLVAGQSALAILVVPASAFWAGPWGVGWAILGVEIAGSIGGWVLLARLGLARRLGLPPIGSLAGCLALAAACHVSKEAPFPFTCLSGALAYGVVSVLFARPRNGRELAAEARS